MLVLAAALVGAAAAFEETVLKHPPIRRAFEEVAEAELADAL